MAAQADLSCRALFDVTADTVTSFARALFDSAELAHAGRPPDRTFGLPGVRLEVRAAGSYYLGLCDAALVDRPACFDLPETTLSVAVMDAQTTPDLPRGRWVAPRGAPEFSARLAESGLVGAIGPAAGQWMFYDTHSGTGVQAMDRQRQHAPWESSMPLLAFLHWAAMDAGRRIVHAGSLGSGGNGVLIAGSGGAGKSGATLAGLKTGLQTVGDDYVLIDRRDGRIAAYPVSRLMKQDELGLRRNGLDPAARGFTGPNWQHKYEFPFSAVAPGQPADKLRIRAIVLPRIVTGATRLSEASGKDAMLALTPSNLQQMPGGWQYSVGFVAELARSVPVFRLDVGPDPTETADIVRARIAEVA